MLQTRLVSSVYNPSNLTEKELVESFVIRKKEFDRLYAGIKSSKMEYPEQHFIIQGQRGSGKTTFLLRLYYEVKNDPDLKDWLIPIRFDEEQYNIRTLYGLWEEIALNLESDVRFSGLYDGMRQEWEYEDYDSRCFDILRKSLNRHNAKILLLIDNFGDLVAKLEGTEVQKLREILMTSPEIRIVGGSAVSLEFNFDYSKPFFEFFKVVELKGLDQKETIDLLLGLGKKYNAGDIQNVIQQSPERVEALRRLTGGVPRTIVLLYEIFADTAKGDSFRDLEVILDRVTPLYKHRMDDLSPQLQQIVHVIAMKWDAVSAKDIADEIREDSKKISAQLQQLEKNRIIQKIRTNTKNNLYHISERFFNIWYLMRYGRKREHNKVRWLVQFLEGWCSRKELVERAKAHMEGMKQGAVYERHAYYITAALMKVGLDWDTQDELLKSTREYLEGRDKELLEEMPKSDRVLWDEVKRHFDDDGYGTAIAKLKHMGSITFNVYNYLARVYSSSNDGRILAFFEDRKECFERQAGNGNVEALFELAKLYESAYNDYEKAEEYYQKAAEKGNAASMNNLAYLYHNIKKDYGKAEEYYQKAVKKGSKFAMLNLGDLYAYINNDYEKAEDYYLKAAEKGHIGAMFYLAILYHTAKNDYEKAEECYLKAVEDGNAYAMYNIAIFYYDIKKDYEQAEKYYLMAAEKGIIDAMNNLALLYHNVKKDYEKAEKYYLKAVENGNYSAMFNLSFLYFARKNNKQKAYNLAKAAFEHKKDVKAYWMYAAAGLWNNQVEESVNLSKQFLHDEEMLTKHPVIVSKYLMLLIAKKQYTYTMKLFKENKNDIADRFKPIYYALVSFMKDDYPNEYNKMGAELKETVEEIIQHINKMAEDYA